MNWLKCKTLLFITLFGLFCFLLIPIVNAETAIKCIGTTSSSGYEYGKLGIREEGEEVTIILFIDDNNKEIYDENHNPFLDTCETWSNKLIECTEKPTNKGLNSLRLNRVTGKLEVIMVGSLGRGIELVLQTMATCEKIDSEPKF